MSDIVMADFGGNMNKNTKIEIENMDLYYGDFHALRNINLEIEKNEITAFIGPSGCGKSSILNIISNLDSLDQVDAENLLF